MARIVHQPIDEAEMRQRLGFAGAGAILSFVGTVRDHHLGRQVTAIEYHAYESMALKEIGNIERAIVERWPEVHVEIAHRVGHLAVEEASVVLVVASPHRVEGFDALRFGIEAIKESVPIWKKEIYPDGHAWIEGS